MQRAGRKKRWLRRWKQSKQHHDERGVGPEQECGVTVLQTDFAGNGTWDDKSLVYLRVTYQFGMIRIFLIIIAADSVSVVGIFLDIVIVTFIGLSNSFRKAPTGTKPACQHFVRIIHIGIIRDLLFK